MATGLGKSIVAGQLIANELLRNPDGEILILAHTVDLVKQLERSIWPMLNKEISTHLWAEGESPAYTGGVTVANMAIDCRRCCQRESVWTIWSSHCR